MLPKEMAGCLQPNENQHPYCRTSLKAKVDPIIKTARGLN